MSHTTIADRLGRVRYVVDSEPHIKVDRDICAQCRDNVCVRVCPATCFTLESGGVTFSHQTCFECGACRISCQNGAVDWSYPKGGFGVQFRF